MNAIRGLSSIGVLIFLVIGFTGLSSIGKQANKDQQTSDAVAPSWSSIYIGETEAEVRGMIGTPSDVTTSTSSDFQGGTTKYDTWTYGTLASTTYSLDFIDGKLDSKSKL